MKQSSAKQESGGGQFGRQSRMKMGSARWVSGRGRGLACKALPARPACPSSVNPRFSAGDGETWSGGKASAGKVRRGCVCTEEMLTASDFGGGG